MSSYNNFLSQIEVDEKELKRDLQNRNKAKKGRNNENINSTKPKGQEKTKVSSQNKNFKGNRQKSKEVEHKRTVQKATQKSKVLQNGPQKNQKIDKARSIEKIQITASEKRKVQNKKINLNDNHRAIRQKKLGDNTHLTKDRKENELANVRRANELAQLKNPSELAKLKKANISSLKKTRPNLTSKRLKDEHVHLRQKKVTSQLDKDKALVEKLTFKISKEEYDDKILGTIHQHQTQTRMIFLKDGEKLSKVPKSVAFLGAYAFLLSVVMIYSFSRVGTVKMDLRKVNAQFNELNEVNAQLNIKLATAYNIDNIRQRAENELYMSKPEAHQIMYITVVPENYVEYEIGSDDE